MVKWIVLAVIILGGLFLVVAIIVSEQDEDRTTIFLNHLEGLNRAPYNDGVSVRIQVEGKRLQMVHKGNEIFLPFDQIEQVNIITWEKFFTRALDPVAEGLVGGAIGGDTMAVISAIDAKGRTRLEKRRVKNALEIQYHPQGEYQTVKRLAFGGIASPGMILQFAKNLCRYANLPGPNFIEPESKPQGPTYL